MNHACFSLRINFLLVFKLSRFFAPDPSFCFPSFPPFQILILLLATLPSLSPPQNHSENCLPSNPVEINGYYQSNGFNI